MIKFKLPNNYFIQNLDDKNWSITKVVKSGNGTNYEEHLGYYPNLEYAWRGAVDHFAITAESNKELWKVLGELRELRVSIAERSECKE